MRRDEIENEKRNKFLLGRLQDTKSTFDMIKLDDTRREQEKFLDKFTKYPHIFKVDSILEI